MKYKIKHQSNFLTMGKFLNPFKSFAVIIVFLLICQDRLNAQGVLQFKSGFEPNVTFTDFKLIGADNTVDSNINNWSNISNYVNWVVTGNSHMQGGTASIAIDPVSPSNHVFLLQCTAIEDDLTRSQYGLLQNSGWIDDGKPNKFEKQFYRCKMYVPSDVANSVSKTVVNPWYMVWESHAWNTGSLLDRTRHGIYFQKPGGTEKWYFRVIQQHPPQTTTWEAPLKVEVPFDRWFTLEIFFRYSETDGEFYVAIVDNGVKYEIARYKGSTKNGTKLHDQISFKNYCHGDYITLLANKGYINGVRHYYDDFEIWSDYPNLYWGPNSTENQNSIDRELDKIYVNNNPYSGKEKVTFSNIPLGSKISIYSIKGQFVKNSLAFFDDGKCNWDGTDDSGKLVANGTYTALIACESRIKSMKIMVVR